MKNQLLEIKYVRWSAVAIAALFILFCLWKAVSSTQPFVLDQTKYYPVTYVVDGDTFKVQTDKKVITVRMLGINTPETVDPRKPQECYGPEASHETKTLLTGMRVKLSLNPKREVTDKYGRYLAYVYREDGLFINEFLLEKGFAREYTVGKPYSFQKEFKNMESLSQKEKRGLWGVCEDTIKRLEKLHINFKAPSSWGFAASLYPLE